MSNVNRQVLSAILIDQDSNVPVEDCIVIKFDDKVVNVTEEGLDKAKALLAQVLLMSGGDSSVEEAIAKHNEKRKKMVNLEIQDSTGNEVKLRPITISDLNWKIK